MQEYLFLNILEENNITQFCLNFYFYSANLKINSKAILNIAIENGYDPLVLVAETD